MPNSTTQREPPYQVERSISLWLIAVGASVAETLLQVAQAFATIPAPGASVWQAAIRMLLYTWLWVLVLRLRKGERWLRIGLAVVPGVLGLLVMLAPVLGSITAGYSLFDFLGDADGWSWLSALLRFIHVGALVPALIAMFHPQSQRFFLRRQAVSSRAQARPQQRKAATTRRQR